jgi:hypothetical protein
MTTPRKLLDRNRPVNDAVSGGGWICYGAPAPVGEVERRLLADLQARAGVPVPEAGARAAVAGTEAAIAAALSDEVSAGS